MNTTALKSFAPAVRRQLMEAVARKLDFVLSTQTPDYLTTFAPQVDSLRNLALADRPGLIERVAYTWFNRLTALRYLDAKGWHPFHARVLTPASAQETQPELLKLTRTGALPEELRRHTNPARLNDILDGRIPSPDAQGEVYRQLVLASCRFYNALLPSLFEKLDDETELLLPEDLLTEQSIAQGFRTEISDADCAQVEILGWLYQFYISEKKDWVMGRRASVPAEDIPAVTQLFTPHWIVRYLVENSLGRLWLLNRPASRLREQMPYYVETETEADFLRIRKPQDIRLLDPAAGSGHMLTYAFDLLYAIYEEEGYAPADIPGLILVYNLHGVEICPRAAQLSALALVLKAREKSRGFFQGDNLVQPRIVALRDVGFGEEELREYVGALNLGDLFSEPMVQLFSQFKEAKTFGSLIEPAVDETGIALARRAIEAKDLSGQLFLNESHAKVLRLLYQAEFLTQRYHVVVANPPYMGSGQMNHSLKAFAKERFPASKSDTFAMFIERGLALTLPHGHSAQITMQTWMFLGSYEDLRHRILESRICSCLHIGYNTFPELNSKIARGAAFVLSQCPAGEHRGVFWNLTDAPQSADKEQVFLAKQNKREYHSVENSFFRALPGYPLAYWLSDKVSAAFSGTQKLGSIARIGKGLDTGCNDEFLRLWWEVSRSETRWKPCQKGGPYRKWYGNHSHVLDWSGDGDRLRRFSGANLRNADCYFRSGLSWTRVSSNPPAFRLFPEGFIFESTGPCLFPHTVPVTHILAYLNSNVAKCFLEVLSPTLDFQSGHISALPAPPSLLDSSAVGRCASALVSLAHADWDNFETSWEFGDLPLLRFEIKGTTLEASWQNWKQQCDAAIRRMQEIETENNRLFSAAYGLQDELAPEVDQDQITLARADVRKDMAAVLSYAVGCMMGRYSLDQPGLILVGAGETLSNYVTKLGKSLDGLSFVADEDGIIPILDGEWFGDDIVARTRAFLRVAFGDATLRENVRFIEESLGKELRKYFVSDFYKDHLQTYKKRPIYWLVQSPRKGFSVLIYLHRYTRDTMNRVLNRYLREYHTKLRNRLAHLAQVQTSETSSARDKATARKEADKLTKTLRECEEWERNTLLPLAQARIELDLDDGVKTNYLKLGEALAPIPGFAAAEE